MYKVTITFAHGEPTITFSSSLQIEEVLAKAHSRIAKFHSELLARQEYYHLEFDIHVEFV